MASITKRTNKKGETVYRIRVFRGIAPDGKQLVRSMTWKPESSMTPRQAEIEAQKQAVLFEARFAEEDKQGLVCKRMKFRQLAEEWFGIIEKTGEMKVSSIIRLKACRNRVYRAFGDQYVDDISYRMIQQFILSLAENGVNTRNGKGIAAKSQRHYITFISDVLRYAKKCGLIKDNPCKDISVVKTDEPDRSPYTLEEEVALLELMYQYNSPLKYQVFFRFLIYCGMRRGEVLGLEWKDIDIETGVCNITRTSNYQNSNTGVYTTTPKTKSSRRSLRLPGELITMLCRYKVEQYTSRLIYEEEWLTSDRLFTKENGAPMHPNTPYHWLSVFCKRHKIPFRGLHNFRHAFASEMIAGNQVDIRTISAVLGHSQTSTTLNIYAHEVQAASAAAMDYVYDKIQEKRKQA